MITRWLEPWLHRSLKNSSAVALLGPRQVGKTTLAQSVAQQMDSIYLDLEAPEDLLKLTDPTGFLDLHRDKLVILDEIQRMPDLFRVLRGVIDQNRQVGRRAGQFLLLGSASMDLLCQSSESLAGRIRYLELGAYTHSRLMAPRLASASFGYGAGFRRVTWPRRIKPHSTGWRI